MPYKNPEDKQKWERDHREQRNVRRRVHRVDAQSGHVIAQIALDRISDQNPRGTWKAILGWAVGIGVVLLAAIGRAHPPCNPKP
jgi:hypothetical protein